MRTDSEHLLIPNGACRKAFFWSFAVVESGHQDGRHSGPGVMTSARVLRFRCGGVSGLLGDPMARAIAGLLVAATGSLCSSAHGQDGSPASVSSEPHPSAESYDPGRETATAPSVGPSDPFVKNRDEIVVTAPSAEADMRMPSTEDDRAAAAAAAARTPCAGCVVISGNSVSIGFGRPPPMPLLIDLKAIPEAPPGSDAARYSEQ
jgi:hypothetical protein